jgi:cold shock CspA family protein
MKPSMQRTCHGVVLFVKDNGSEFYGFIQPFGSNGDRGANVYFNSFASQGNTDIHTGDEVDFILSNTRNLCAHRVWVRNAGDNI